MEILKAEIENFKAFDGDSKKNSIDCRVTKNKPMIVIVGENGYGKSTIWEAINWAFFGKNLLEERIASAKKSGEEWSMIMDITPSYVEAIKNKKNHINVKVDVDIKLDQGEIQNVSSQFPDIKGNLLISRSCKLKFRQKQNNPNVWDYDAKSYQDDLKIMYKTEKKGLLPLEFNTIKNANNFIYNFAPYGIRRYYFFDAASENIETLASDNKKVEVAIKDLSGINKAHNVVEIINHYIQHSQSTDPVRSRETEKNQLMKSIHDVHVQMGKLSDEIHTKGEERQSLNEEIKILSEKLSKNKIHKDKINTINQNKSEIVTSEGFEKLSRTKIGKSVAEKFPKIIMHELLNNIRGSIAKEKERGLWPKIITGTDIDTARQLEKQHDVTESISKKDKLDLKKMKNFTKKLFDELEKLGSKDAKHEGTDVVGLERQYNEFSMKSLEDYDELRDSLFDLVDYQTKIEALKDANKDLFEEMRLDPENLDEAEEDIRAYEDLDLTLGRIDVDYKIAQTRLEKFRDPHGQHETNLKKLMKITKDRLKGTQKAKQIEMLEELKNIINGQIKPFELSNREELEEGMVDVIKKVFGKEAAAERLEIDNAYKIKGLEGVNIGSQSRGQKLVVALAFIFSLIKASYTSPPLLIDAPLAHTSGKYGIEVFKCFSSFCPQSIHFLMAGREIHLENDEPETNLIKEKSNKIYVINKKDKLSPIRISEYKGD